MNRATLKLGVTMLVLASGLVHAERVFAPAEIIEWQHHSFTGQTRYELTEVDGREAIHAVCDENTASGLFLRERIDLNETPIVEWEWRVDKTFRDIDERIRAGDDYAARLYVVDEHPVLRWRTRAINYVWASEEEQSSSWENAYQPRVIMVAVRSGDAPQPGRWRAERRNLKEDFKTYHGRDLVRLDALALMTDCDDAGEPVEAWYGAVRLLPE